MRPTFIWCARSCAPMPAKRATRWRASSRRCASTVMPTSRRRTTASRRRSWAQGEAYALQGSLPAAIEQLQLARSAGDGDFYQLSVVDARLKELRAQYAAEMKEAKR